MNYTSKTGPRDNEEYPCWCFWKKISSFHIFVVNNVHVSCSWRQYFGTVTWSISINIRPEKLPSVPFLSRIIVFWIIHLCLYVYIYIYIIYMVFYTNWMKFSISTTFFCDILPYYIAMLRYISLNRMFWIRCYHIMCRYIKRYPFAITWLTVSSKYVT